MLTLDGFLDLLQAYNTAIWPMQVVANILGLIALISVFVSYRKANFVVLTVLSFLWLWTGSMFCLVYWTALSKPAYLFGVMFIVQGVLFVPMISQTKLSFRFVPSRYSLLGLVLIAYAMVGYPIVGNMLNHIFPRSLPFGVVPCPTTIFTIGMLLLTDKPFPRYLATIPLVWSLFGVVPVMRGIGEDIGLVLSGIVGIVFLVLRGNMGQSAASAATN